MKIGEINITATGNSGILIENKNTIYIDPFQLEKTDKKADVILITHPHYDHCSVQDIEAIVKEGTSIIIPPDCQSKISKLKQQVDMQLIEAGDEINIKGIKIMAVPAYNINKPMHPKSEGWLGYIIKFDGLEIYHAGDTDIIPEMEKLVGFQNLVALLPIDGKFTMNVEEAAKAAKIIKPKIAVPMHYGTLAENSENAIRFLELCKQSGINAEILERK